MQYISTRGNKEILTAAAAIKRGIAPDGGLYVPCVLPCINKDWSRLATLTYQELAKEILALYLDDYAAAAIDRIVDSSYGKQNFDDEKIAPLVSLNERLHVLELWHGPTAAFKDMALQIMPRLLTEAIDILGEKQEIAILVATSGDTGKAALEGFKNIPGIKVIVFYPHNGVSAVQKLQMATTDGFNTYVVAVNGNFDDCQNSVKKIFGDEAMIKDMAAQGRLFSSANSINWGRLLPQIIYYFWSYAQLIQADKIKAGEAFNVVVPTGNFGNILAAYYARQMGLPIYKLLCASNINNVLSDVLNTGLYDRRRQFYKTTSPSMDILISSNFERFLFATCGADSAYVSECFNNLQTNGYFAVNAAILERWRKIIWGGFASEDAVAATIRRCFAAYNYALDPHTAVGMNVYEQYLAQTGDDHQVVLAATASPFKFPQAVLHAIGGHLNIDLSELKMLEKLSSLIHMPVHRCLAGLDSRPVLHDVVVEVSDMARIVRDILA